jgi:hypothetical protein
MFLGGAGPERVEGEPNDCQDGSDEDGESRSGRGGRRRRSPRRSGERTKLWSERVKGTQSEEGAREDRCAFFLVNKKRYCSMPHHGQLYCGVHRPRSQEPLSETSSRKIRVPCPIDPSHSVFASDMKRHVHVCGTKVQKDLAAAQPFFSADINSGPGVTASPSGDAVLPRDDPLELCRLVAALHERHVDAPLAGHLDPARLADLVDRARSDGREERCACECARARVRVCVRACACARGAVCTCRGRAQELPP